MDLQATLVELERAGWQSLVDGTGRAYFRDRLVDDAAVLVPGSGVVAGLATGADALDRISGASWAWFRIRAPKLVVLADTVAVLAYRVVARRDFDVEYQAVVSSTYVTDGADWKLAIHQQTPV
ncbi:MAG: hypothetical protein U5K29_03185 [Acidimicrobiales bacterium]|nr:hypothetical protein [Acidimicrobiales bacterium]